MRITSKRVAWAVVALLSLGAVTLVAADIVSVKGTASGFYIPPTGYLAKIGYQLDPDGSFEFSYTYDSSNEFSTGSLKLVSKSKDGSILDAVDLKPTTVWVHELNDVPDRLGGRDEYVAGAASSRNGTTFQILVDLVDSSKTMLPHDPAYYLNNPWPEMYIGVGVADPDCDPNFCIGFIALITSMSATVTPVIVDTDKDGVPDSVDKCPGSASGPVNADGCTVTQLVPCRGPATGGAWKNHGQYVSEVAKIAEQFVKNGLMTEEQRDALLGDAAKSGCGQ